MLPCTYCSREFKNPGGKATHEPYCPSNPNRQYRSRSHITGRKKGSIPWNKGLKNDPRQARPDLHGVRWGASKNGHSAETKARLSEIAKERKLGGYNRGSGRGKKGWYKGFWCDSSYELAWIIYQLDHGIRFVRNNQKFTYTWQDKICYWIPDFILEDGSYIEIKGYETPQTRAKFNDFPHALTVLKEKQLGSVFQYVIDVYGKDYVRLYETEGAGVGSPNGLENRSS